MIAIFVDGPLASETMPVPEIPPIIKKALPARFTLCTCEDFHERIAQHGPEIVTYHRVAGGRTVGIYSIEDNDEAIMRALKYWVASDFTAKAWQNGCQSRRAFA